MITEPDPDPDPEHEPDSRRAHDGASKSILARDDPYRGVLLVLLALVLLGAAGAFVATFTASVSVDAFVMLAIAAGVLTSVLVSRSMPAADADGEVREPTADEDSRRAAAARTEEPPRTDESSADEASRSNEQKPAPQAPPSPPSSPSFDLRKSVVRLRQRVLDTIRMWLPGFGLFVIAVELLEEPVDPMRHGTAFVTALAAAACLVSAAVAAAAAHYLARADATSFPEGAPLARGARVMAWLFVVVAGANGAAWFALPVVNRTCHLVALAVMALACAEMMWRTAPAGADPRFFPLDLGVLVTFGGRANVVASALDAAERGLGIDLRSTWTLNVLRRSVAPLVLGLAVMGWLSTSASIVALGQRALVERFGVPLGGPALGPGIHLHGPWPIDRVIRVETDRVRALEVGHEGELQTSGPENVLWARPHAKEEYTFLLGNGRDLIAIGAVLQFRIADARAWHYGFTDPTSALRGLTYRALLRATVNRTLDQALSENVAKLAANVQASVQRHADALGLGVEVVSFTIHGMHPPMSVAQAYQAVVSSQVGEVTAVANATSYENQTVPAARGEAIVAVNGAHAQGARDRAQAAGEAWSFRTVEAEYKASPAEFRFRRRLETLEQGLGRQPYTVIDTDILGNGGGLWLRP